MSSQAHKTYEFGPFRLELKDHLLSRNGKPISLTPRAFDVLVCLIDERGHLVSKDELMEKVWADSFVEEGNVSRTIWMLRKELGDKRTPYKYIQTITKRGYRFVADVRVTEQNVAFSQQVDKALAEQIDSGREKLLKDDGSLKEDAQSSRYGADGTNGNYFPEYIDEDRDRPAVVESYTDGAQTEVVKSWLRHHLSAITASASLLVIAVLVIAFLPRIWRSGPNTPIRSLAVLPFENLSGDPSQNYFADGITDELTQNLTQISALTVMSRTLTKQYYDHGKTPQEIANELKVDSIMTGTVQRSEGKVRVSAQLINATSGSNIWAQTYVRDQADVVKLESEIARSIVGEIRIKLTPAEEKRLLSARKVDPDAYNEFLLGQASYEKRTEADLRDAVTHYQRAVEIDPEYALAYARLANAWLNIGVFGDGDLTDVEIPERKAALKAVELDPDLAEGHIALYFIKQCCDRDLTGAEEEIKRAVDLDPGNARSYQVYSWLLSAEGRNTEAIEKIEKALELGPNNASMESAFGQILYNARRYDEAILHQTRALEFQPNSPEPHVRRGQAYLRTGKYEDALSDFEKAAEAQPRHQVLVALAYAFSGRRREALQILSASRYIPFNTAQVYVALGEKDKAFEILERAVERPDILMLYLKCEPGFDSLHSDPRWEPLIRRLNIPQI
jgi:TolB-like protein/DNA-binding winged helix-turn-helix (wHTH) protein/Tfp pilus assembly protein PilF